jgi:acetyl-CoA acetyltransferase
MWSKRGEVAVAGIAMTKMVRYLDRPLGPVTVETCLAAMEDAGLQPGDIDGVSCLPYEGEGGARVDGVQLRPGLPCDSPHEVDPGQLPGRALP